MSKPKGGTTVVTVNSAALTALTNAGVTVTPSGTATASGTSFTFPITSATISDFRISLSAGKTGRLDVKLGKSKLKLATLSNVAVNATSKSINATATLTANAVTMLNTAFGTTLPKRGAALGTLVITPAF